MRRACTFERGVVLLLDFEPRRLHDASPFADLGLNERLELIGTAADALRSERRKPCLRIGLRERFHRLAMEHVRLSRRREQ